MLDSPLPTDKTRTKNTRFTDVTQPLSPSLHHPHPSRYVPRFTNTQPRNLHHSHPQCRRQHRLFLLPHLHLPQTMFTLLFRRTRRRRCRQPSRHKRAMRSQLVLMHTREHRGKFLVFFESGKGGVCEGNECGGTNRASHKRALRLLLHGNSWRHNNDLRRRFV